MVDKKNFIDAALTRFKKAQSCDTMKLPQLVSYLIKKTCIKNDEILFLLHSRDQFTEPAIKGTTYSNTLTGRYDHLGKAYQGCGVKWDMAQRQHFALPTQQSRVRIIAMAFLTADTPSEGFQRSRTPIETPKIRPTIFSMIHFLA